MDRKGNTFEYVQFVMHPRFLLLGIIRLKLLIFADKSGAF